MRTLPYQSLLAAARRYRDTNILMHTNYTNIRIISINSYIGIDLAPNNSEERPLIFGTKL